MRPDRPAPGHRLRHRSHGVVTAVVTALLTLATVTAAAPAHAAGSGADPARRDYVLLAPAHVPLTEPGHEQPLDQLLGRIRAMEPGPQENHAPRAGRRSGQDELPAYECREQDAAFHDQGYGKSRFVSCQAFDLHPTHVTCWWIFCSVTGSADAEMTDIQYGHNARREVDVVQVFDNWRLEGDIAEVPLSVNVTCTAREGFGPCVVDSGFGGPYVQPIGLWAAEGSITSRYYSFRQDAPGGLGAALISYADLAAHVSVIGEGAANPYDGPNSGIRCDSAPYLVTTAAGEGCVFPWVTETLHIYRADHPESADHIITAQYHPDQTVPDAPNKRIPGAPGAAPLHRVADQAAIDAHRAVAVAACQTYFPNYAHEGLDCDEYPFASTLEGADDNLKNYSVEPIHDWDNRGSGGKLSAFYQNRRILGSDFTNDPFHVQVDP
ncbi:NucA/NucB deoxyribonuclease domain-containing protein [Kitasatospora sp. NPDC059327]|uniref:NucA/NucB deoxyribonuclease domain-containing protein n=1 Tax=Kitasatospora sp. NPDC059327 TaxID=3346803 RepID=UPI0036A13C34